MTVFKAILKIAKREWTTILIYFVVFAGFGTLTARGNAQQTSKIYKEAKETIAVLDESHSIVAKELIHTLKKSEKVITPKTKDLVSLNDSVRFDLYDYVLVLPEDFEERVLAGRDDAAEYISAGDSAGGYLLSEKIRLYLQDVVLYLKSGYSKEEAAVMASDVITSSLSVSSEMLPEAKHNEESFLSGIFRFSAYALMMLLIEVICSIINNIRQIDIRKRISVSGAKFRERNAAFYGAVAIVAVVLTGLLILFIVLSSIGDPDLGKLPYYILNEAAIMLCAIGLATMISSITTDQSLVSMITNSVVISMSFLCGIFVPMELMSKQILWFSHFLPLYWFERSVEFINSNADSAIMGTTFAAYLGIQLLFGLVFFVIGMIVFKKKELYAV